VKFLLQSGIGIIQMPCPEMLCLGLDRGNIRGGEQPVIAENTRIRRLLDKPSSVRTITILVHQLVFQIEEYIQNGFTVLGIVGINRSPSCGVNTTSMNNKEVEDEDVFINVLRGELEKRNIHIRMIGIKSLEMKKALISIRKLLS
jgi:predicted secreted protein